MENKNDYKEERFDSFLNKTIILSSKEYYRKELTNEARELKIIDDEDSAAFLESILKYDDVYNFEDTNSFIDTCENPVLIRALKSLSDIEMTVIFLLFERQLTSIEASEILKICTGSLSRIKKRALKKIKRHLKEEK